MKRIYLIRHGQTDFNRQGIVQGSGVDASLNELGKKQAEAFYQHFGHVPFDKVYTSVLKRTHESVARFLKFTPHEPHAELNEISWGVFEGKVARDEERQQMNDLVANWNSGQLHHAPHRGESPLQVAERQKRFVPIITERNEEQNILICSHGRAMRIFLCVLLDLPLIEMDRFAHQNLCLYELEYHANSGFTLVRENYTGHLEFKV
ncbi:histidine phosphatase family protein [bacterium]|nr:histidine phosphatase family protein [bacterium]